MSVLHVLQCVALLVFFFFKIRKILSKTFDRTKK
jgi:hypothetical protein